MTHSTVRCIVPKCIHCKKLDELANAGERFSKIPITISPCSDSFNNPSFQFIARAFVNNETLIEFGSSESEARTLLEHSIIESLLFSSVAEDYYTNYDATKARPKGLPGKE